MLSQTPEPSAEIVQHTRWLAGSVASALERGDPIAKGTFDFLVGGRNESEEFAGVVGKVVHHLQSGDTWDKALARFPEFFPRPFVDGVRSALCGEEGAPSLAEFLREHSQAGSD